MWYQLTTESCWIMSQMSSILDVGAGGGGLYLCLGTMHKSNLDEQFPKGTKVQNLKLQVCSGMYDPLLPPCIRGLNKLQIYWISTHFQLFITNFTKILSLNYKIIFSGSRNSQFQETPLNSCFRNNSFTRVVKIWKWLQNVSVAAVRGCF